MRILNNGLSPYVFIFSVTGAILGVSILLLYFWFLGSFEGSYLRLNTIMVAAVLVTLHTIKLGQYVEDRSSEILEILQQMKWYYWNRENKNLYLMFLLDAQKPFQLKFSDTVAVNYSLGVSVAKFIYSTISVTSRLRDVDFAGK
ncbi:hypothetical protein Zmor_008523 [Zophobas morio]|uniref:Uncharacterized protein n=1 Tax=Zophobas morio TaxID=2755281 RepID=A0AA38MQF9_9CUCU|nr:hypothetical protein Zmor_008523 [Zophobas morio]